MRGDDDVPPVCRVVDRVLDQLAELLGLLDAPEVDLDRPLRVLALGVGDGLGEDPRGPGRLGDDRVVGERVAELLRDRLRDRAAVGALGV